MIDVVNKISICKVEDSHAINRDCVLNRLFDINIDSKDGIVEKPLIVDHKPYIFENRTRIFKNDGPSVLGFVGVWKWTASPNKNNDKDHVTDYIQSEYCPDIKPIFVIIINDAHSIDDLIKPLKNGIKSTIDLENNKCIIAYKKLPGFYEGIYCDPGVRAKQK